MSGFIDLGRVKGDAGAGIARGGTAGQALVKKNGSDFETEWKTLARSVNGTQADEAGDVKINEVAFARGIVSDSALQESAEFILRTTGGESSIQDGSAWLGKIMGARIHTGYVPESLNMTVTAAPRSEGETPITASFDRDTFLEEVSTSGTYTMTYTTGWSADPADYGVTVYGDPISGDVITIVYVKEDRGTITVAAPTALKSTGWNLYNHSVGYARVVKYSNTYGFLIGGTYTAVKYSETLDGAQTTITPNAGAFTVPGDGYIWVTGGNNTDTFILMTWSDWGSGYEGSFAAYNEDSVSLTTPMAYFPYGIMQVGGVRDEIDLTLGVAYSRIERMAYTAENAAAAAASGRDWEADENYIYLVRAVPVQYTFSGVDREYTANDHGMESFAGTSVPVFCQILYGENLVDKLRHDIPETLTAHGQLMEAIKGDLGVVENGNNATHTISAGQFVIWKGVLKTAKTAIPSGTALSSTNLADVPSGGLNALNGNIAALSNKMTRTTGECTPGEGITFSNVVVERSGNICILHGYCTIADSIQGNNKVILTIPSGFRPSATTYVRLFSTYAGTNGYFTFQLSSGGSLLSSIGSSTLTGTIQLEIMYIAS